VRGLWGDAVIEKDAAGRERFNHPQEDEAEPGYGRGLPFAILQRWDDQAFGELLRTHLEDRGHGPHIACTLEQGRKWLAGNAPDAILLDHQ